MADPNIEQHTGTVVNQHNYAPTGDVHIHQSPAAATHELPKFGSGWTSRNEVFTGREAELAEIHSVPQGKVVGLTGLPGAGKSQIAVEYAHRHHESYRHIFKVTAERPGQYETQMADLARELRLPEAEATEQEVRFRAVQNWFRNHSGWLLIVDNAENLVALSRQLPASPGGKILLTTREKMPSNLGRSIEVRELPEDLGALLLLRVAGYAYPDSGQSVAGSVLIHGFWLDAEEFQEALAVSRELGGLALALDHAGAYMVGNDLSPSQYLEQFHRYRSRLLDENLDREHQTVTASFLMALEKLAATPGTGPSAVQLIRICAFLNPDEIPELILRAPGDAIKEPLRAFAADELAWGRIIRAATSTSLVHHEGYAFQLHRLVAEVARWSLSPKEYSAIFDSAGTALSAVFPMPDFEHWSLCAALTPSVLALCQLYHPSNGASIDLGPLLSRCYGLLSHLARYQDAEFIVRFGLDLDEASYGKDHPSVARDLNNLAALLLKTNRLSEAEPLMRRALAIDEASYGMGHPNVARDLNNLAQLLQATNRLSESEPLMRRALKSDEDSYGKDHPNVAIRLNNLAHLLQATNRLSEAESLMRRGLDIEIASRGPNHPFVAIQLSNLALLLKDTNRFAEAEPLMRRALQIDEESYGKDHPNLARDLDNLALLLKDTNRLAEAEPLMRRALKIDEASYGEDHPDVARDLNNLTQLLKATNRRKEAEPLMVRALQIFEQSLGPDHPNTQIVRKNLETLRKELEDGLS